MGSKNQWSECGHHFLGVREVWVGGGAPVEPDCLTVTVDWRPWLGERDGAGPGGAGGGGREEKTRLWRPVIAFSLQVLSLFPFTVARDFLKFPDNCYTGPQLEP